MSEIGCCLCQSEASSVLFLTAVRPVPDHTCPLPCALPQEPVTVPVLWAYSCLNLTFSVIPTLDFQIQSLSLCNCCLFLKLWLFDYTCGHFHFPRLGDCFLPLWLYLSTEVTLWIFNNWPSANQSVQSSTVNNWCGYLGPFSAGSCSLLISLSSVSYNQKHIWCFFQLLPSLLFYQTPSMFINNILSGSPWFLISLSYR